MSTEKVAMLCSVEAAKLAVSTAWIAKKLDSAEKGFLKRTKAKGLKVAPDYHALTTGEVRHMNQSTSAGGKRLKGMEMDEAKRLKSRLRDDIADTRSGFGYRERGARDHKVKVQRRLEDMKRNISRHREDSAAFAGDEARIKGTHQGPRGNRSRILGDSERKVGWGRGPSGNPKHDFAR